MITAPNFEDMFGAALTNMGSAYTWSAARPWKILAIKAIAMNKPRRVGGDFSVKGQI